MLEYSLPFARNSPSFILTTVHRLSSSVSGCRIRRPPTPQGIAMLLLERDKQLALLARWHDATATRGGCITLVTGEAGIGKTALVSEFARRRGPAIRVLWGSCDPLSTPQPLGPLRDVGRQVGGALLDAVTQGTSRERIFAAVIDELERPGKPLVLVIEDMHWADDATLIATHQRVQGKGASHLYTSYGDVQKEYVL